jgi:hypothetical protein
VFKTKKNIRLFFILLKILLFLSVFWLFFNQINRADWSKWNEIQLKYPIVFTIVILLTGLNWGIEFLKWQLITHMNSIQLSSLDKRKSFFAGIITGFLTPNMLGNFIGRMYYFQRRDRPTVILLTLYSNAAQFLASIYFGIIAVCWLGLPHDIPNWSNGLFLTLVISGTLGLTFLYFKAEKIPLKLLQEHKLTKRIQPILAKEKSFKRRMLVLSLLRHFVFASQYWLLLKSLGLEIPWSWIGWIWQIFFWATLIPSIWFGKLVIRESMALWILGSLSGQPALILFASILLWIINQAVPAIIGIPFLKTNATN